MNRNYLESSKKQFAYYKLLGEKTFEQVADDDLFWQYNPECNSIATVVKHLSGNMLSRWTDILTTDGEKPWRNREEEFSNNIKSRDAMIAVWEKGWQCLFNALVQIQEEDLTKIIYIRNQGHTILEAINRQLAHYPYHVGQIVFMGKMICGTQWKSLSIPRGESNRFNQEKFAHPKQ